MARRSGTPGFELFIGQLFDLYDRLSKAERSRRGRTLRAARVAVRQIDAYKPGDEVEAFNLEVAREMLTDLIRDLGGQV
jgi:hypothetical protein